MQSSTETRSCPFCRQGVTVDAKFCRHCGARFNADPSARLNNLGFTFADYVKELGEFSQALELSSKPKVSKPSVDNAPEVVLQALNYAGLERISIAQAEADITEGDGHVKVSGLFLVDEMIMLTLMCKGSGPIFNVAMMAALRLKVPDDQIRTDLLETIMGDNATVRDTTAIYAGLAYTARTEDEQFVFQLEPEHVVAKT